MPVTWQRGKSLPLFIPAIEEEPLITEKLLVTEADGFANPKLTAVFCSHPSAIVLLELLIVVFRFITPPPKRFNNAFAECIALTGDSIMLSHGFLSIHLHIAMQFSICHHPDLLTTFILMESMGNAIADFLSLDSRNGAQAPSAGDGLPALMRQTRKGGR